MVSLPLSGLLGLAAFFAFDMQMGRLLSCRGPWMPSKLHSIDVLLGWKPKSAFGSLSKPRLCLGLKIKYLLLMDPISNINVYTVTLQVIRTCQSLENNCLAVPEVINALLRGLSIYAAFDIFRKIASSFNNIYLWKNQGH